jgi:hypothetical protein
MKSCAGVLRPTSIVQTEQAHDSSASRFDLVPIRCDRVLPYTLRAHLTAAQVQPWSEASIACWTSTQHSPTEALHV